MIIPAMIPETLRYKLVTDYLSLTGLRMTGGLAKWTVEEALFLPLMSNYCSILYELLVRRCVRSCHPDNPFEGAGVCCSHLCCISMIFSSERLDYILPMYRAMCICAFRY